MITAGTVTFILGYPIRTAVLVGFSLSQIGEFSFVLLQVGNKYNLLNQTLYQLMLNVTVITMLTVPFLIAAAPHLSDLIVKLPFLPSGLKKGTLKLNTSVSKEKDHLVIIGFGFNGRNLAKVAKLTKIPYVILDMNPETVKNEKEKGEPIYYGDASHMAVLEHLNVKDARVIAVAINDPASARSITDTIRRITLNAYIIVRTRYNQEMNPLYELGADVVIPEEFETSIEILTRVLEKYLVSKDEIDNITYKIRSEGYEMFRNLDSGFIPDLKVHIPDVKIETIQIDKGSEVEGKTLAELQLRRMYNISILAIIKDKDVLSNPHGDIVLPAGSRAVIMGKYEKICRASELFRNK
jgi:CPA2 family monovalent cation:H+ antiporter-2